MAAFVTFHLVVVLLQLLPNPPRLDDRALRMPDVRTELARVSTTVARWTGRSGDEDAVQDELIAAVRAWDGVVDGIQSGTRLYLEPIGSVQRWNMFGGNARTFPRLLQVDVLPEGETEPVRVVDHRWGRIPAVHRHRKVARGLSAPGHRRQREAYAAWHARQWDLAHPDRPAAEVHLWYDETRTPPASRADRGRGGSKRRLGFEWVVP